MRPLFYKGKAKFEQDRAGPGRRVVRGIRGSGLDIFKRW